MTFVTGRVHFRAFPLIKITAQPFHNTRWCAWWLMSRFLCCCCCEMWGIVYDEHTHASFFIPPFSRVLGVLQSSYRPCSQNTDGIHWHAQTGSCRNGWWIGHSSLGGVSTVYFCTWTFFFFNCWSSCWWHLTSHLNVFSASCTILKLLHQVKKNSAYNNIPIRRSYGWDKNFNDFSHSWYHIYTSILEDEIFLGYFIIWDTFVKCFLPDVKKTFSRCDFDFECMWICLRLSHTIISNPRCLQNVYVLIEIFISTFEDQKDPNRSLQNCSTIIKWW